MFQERDAGRFVRRSMLRVTGAGSALALFGGVQQASAATLPTHPKWKFVFVNHVTTNPFFVPTQYGIEDACALLDCDYQWTGSTNADVAEMVNAMNAAIAAKAAAIAVPIVDPHAFDAPVRACIGSRHSGALL